MDNLRQGEGSKDGSLWLLRCQNSQPYLGTVASCGCLQRVVRRLVAEKNILRSLFVLKNILGAENVLMSFLVLRGRHEIIQGMGDRHEITQDLG